MASLRLPLPMVKVMAASKAQTKEPEKKSFIDWLAGKIEREHMVETDPILKKVEGTSNGAARPLGKNTLVAKRKGVSPPPEPEKKPGLFDGLFGK
ncbi:hypothetical protein SUGI_0123320 [Cryptomeria japonica]|nr:hypothetical protein SUGI_0123320 [Cryptomeria japonica]